MTPIEPPTDAKRVAVATTRKGVRPTSATQKVVRQAINDKIGESVVNVCVMPTDPGCPQSGYRLDCWSFAPGHNEPAHWLPDVLSQEVKERCLGGAPPYKHGCIDFWDSHPESFEVLLWALEIQFGFDRDGQGREQRRLLSLMYWMLVYHYVSPCYLKLVSIIDERVDQRPHVLLE